jgi:hypothetical protein
MLLNNLNIKKSKTLLISYRKFVKFNSLFKFSSCIFFKKYNFFLFIKFYNIFFFINYFKVFFIQLSKKFFFINNFVFSKKVYYYANPFCFFNISYNLHYFYYFFFIYFINFYLLTKLLFIKERIKPMLKAQKFNEKLSLYKLSAYNNVFAFSTFQFLLEKLFFLLKLRILFYQKKLNNSLNCFIRFKRHNIFITVTTALNVPLLVFSSGKSGYGQRTKLKISSQAAAKSAVLIAKTLVKKRLSVNLNVFILSNRLFDKRIKSIFTAFSQKGLKILHIIPKLRRCVGGVRQKKSRRV